MKHLISIIIPCYNIENHLQKCIDSILNQTYSHFELLLINDGSTDTSLEICKAYANKDNRVRVFTHENKGVSYTRNRGIKEAKGDYVMFVDGDDYVKQDFVQKHINFFQDKVLIISGFENDKRVQTHAFLQLLEKNKNNDIPIKNILKVLKYDSLNTPCCRLFERDILIDNHIFFNESISYQEDLIFNLSYCKFINSIRPINYLGYYYINNPNSSSKKFHKNLSHTESLFQDLKFYILNENDQKTFSKFILETLLFKISNIFHQNTDFKINERYNNLGELINSPFFITGLKSIKEMNLNFVLHILLISRRVCMIFFYFNTRFYFTKFKKKYLWI